MKRNSSNKTLAPFRPRSDAQYLAFFKPYGYLCQFTQPDNSDKRTLAEFAFPRDVYAVGRLDWDSEGLLLLSDDGALNNLLLNPQQKHERTYLVQVENRPDESALRKLEQGVVIEGKRTLPARARVLTSEPQLPPRPVPIRYRANIPTAWIELTIFEGRNRQVRKMTAAVGHPTLRLVRKAIGRLDIFDLALEPGNWRRLERNEIMKVFE